MSFVADVVDSAGRSRLALVTIGADGERREIAFGEVADRSARLAPDRALQPEDVVHAGRQAGNPQRRAIAEEDLGERAADDGPHPPALE